LNGGIFRFDKEDAMTSDKRHTHAPARQQAPASATPSKGSAKPLKNAPDAAKAEPVPHKRPPVRSDDN
jgi:hypothetical protein